MENSIKIDLRVNPTPFFNLLINLICLLCANYKIHCVKSTLNEIFLVVRFVTLCYKFKLYNMKKLVLTVFCLAGGAISIIAQHSVTLSVNMTGLTVDPNGVHVAGSFQQESGATGDWKEGETAMQDVGGGIYSYTTSATIPDGVYEFKFINGNVWSKEEQIPLKSQVGGGSSNRFFVVDGNDVTLLPVTFSGSSLIEGGTTRSLLRFTVDLTGTTLDPAGVSVVGDWQILAGGAQNWAIGQNRLYDIIPGDGLDIFTGIFYVPSTSTSFEYNFANDNDTLETVEAACTTATTSIAGSRVVTISGPTAVQYCFGKCTPSCLPTFDLTLNVDMRYTCGFNIATDSVDIAGPYVGWGGGTYLSDPDQDGIFSVTLNDVPGGTFEYKARRIKNNTPTWESGPNKVIQLSSDTTFAPRCFGSNIPGACVPAPDPSTITFRVDMTNEVPAATIYLKASFTNPQWDNGAIALTPTAGSPGVFETTVADICPQNIRFRFVNGPNLGFNGDEEKYPGVTTDTLCFARAGAGWERAYTRTSTDPVTLQFVYNTCTSLTIGFDELASNVATMFPNPATESTFIRFASQTETYSVSVMDVLGKRLNQVNSVRGTFTVYRESLKAGIYIIQVSDSKGHTSNQKLIFN
jgi:hypothetical protein